jgi:ABC-type oligopeptide transport system ATPase subunit
MVMVTVRDKTYHMDGYLKSNLDFVKNRVLFHNDLCVILIDGRSGGGKSTLAMQIAYYLSEGKLTVGDVSFTTSQFAENLNSAQKGDCKPLDEAFDVLNKRTVQSKSNMRLLSMLQKVRSKQIFIIITLPSIFDLDKNLTLNLADVFIHVYRKDFGDRGQYKVYNRKGLKDLWLYCRQSMAYSPKVAQPNFKGRFTKFFPIDDIAYEEKKQKSLDQYQQEFDKTPDATIITERNLQIYAAYKEHKTVREICDLVGLKRSHVYQIIREMKVYDRRTNKK